MITFDRVSLEFQSGQFALRDVSFSIESGSFTFLTGHSGAGKSSLLRLIARLAGPTSGTIRVGSIDYQTLRRSQEAALRRQMGIIFQDNRLLSDRDVFDNVALPLIVSGYRFNDIVTRVHVALRRVGLEHRTRSSIIELSGGEQQRVGIARAVVARPKLLLADEPTGNLDEDISDEIMQLLMQFNASGVTVLFATHDHQLLSNYSFSRLTLSDGQLSQHHSSPPTPNKRARRQSSSAT